jgi:hypothetical protein
MYLAPRDGIQVLHALPGRVRLHVSGWPARRGEQFRKRLLRLDWVRLVRFNALTGNLLVCFDPAASVARLLAVLSSLAAELTARDGAPAPAEGGPRLRLVGEGPDSAPKGDTLKQALASCRWVVEAAEAVLGGKGALLAGGLAAAGACLARLVLEALLDRPTADLVGLLTECVTAALAGSPVTLALALAEAVFRLAQRVPLPALPRPALPAGPEFLSAAA